MAMKITASECTACGSCEFDCPTGAITMKGDAYAINPNTCTECQGVAKAPKCAAGCPADCIGPA